MGELLGVASPKPKEANLQEDRAMESVMAAARHRHLNVLASGSKRRVSGTRNGTRESIAMLAQTASVFDSDADEEKEAFIFPHRVILKMIILNEIVNSSIDYSLPVRFEKLYNRRPGQILFQIETENRETDRSKHGLVLTHESEPIRLQQFLMEKNQKNGAGGTQK